MTPSFYQIDLGQPMSAAHNTPAFWRSRIGQIVTESDGKLYIREAQDVCRNALDAPYIWRVAFVYWKPEDNQMTRFMAFDTAGRMLPEARFGVHWDGGASPPLEGAFAYPPLQRCQYVPVDSAFMTANQGGYAAQVLDRKYPSEACAFGWRPVPDGEGHLVPVIGWQLFQRGANYPNDYEA